MKESRNGTVFWTFEFNVVRNNITSDGWRVNNKLTDVERIFMSRFIKLLFWKIVLYYFGVAAQCIIIMIIGLTTTTTPLFIHFGWEQIKCIGQRRFSQKNGIIKIHWIKVVRTLSKSNQWLNVDFDLHRSFYGAQIEMRLFLDLLRTHSAFAFISA